MLLVNMEFDKKEEIMHSLNYLECSEKLQWDIECLSLGNLPVLSIDRG